MTIPLAVFKPAAATAPAAPTEQLRLAVMVRAGIAWFGLAWFAGQSVLALTLGIWLGDQRMPGVAALGLALAACCWWYLRFPAGVYEPASNTFVEVWPFGLRCRRLPGKPGRTLAVRGRRIVLTGARGRIVLSQILVRPGEYASIARAVGRTSLRYAFAPSGPVRPEFIAPQHRVTGWLVAGVAVAGLLSQVTSIPGVSEVATAFHTAGGEVAGWIGTQETAR